MNWITKFIKPKIKSLFKKKTSQNDERLWISCECKNLIYKEDFNKNYFCCPKCGSHHKLPCKDRFKLFFDNGAYEIIETPLPQDDPLSFIDNKPLLKLILFFLKNFFAALDVLESTSFTPQ